MLRWQARMEKQGECVLFLDVHIYVAEESCTTKPCFSFFPYGSPARDRERKCLSWRPRCRLHQVPFTKIREDDTQSAPFDAVPEEEWLQGFWNTSHPRTHPHGRLTRLAITASFLKTENPQDPPDASYNWDCYHHQARKLNSPKGKGHKMQTTEIEKLKKQNLPRHSTIGKSGVW